MLISSWFMVIMYSAYAHLHAITKRRVALHGLRLLATHAANADRFIIRRLRRCTDGEVIMLDHL